MNALVHFMNEIWGRAARFVLGLALIYVGLALLGSTLGLIVAVIGMVPIAMAIWGHCLIEFVLPQSKHA